MLLLLVVGGGAALLGRAAFDQDSRTSSRASTPSSRAPAPRSRSRATAPGSSAAKLPPPPAGHVYQVWLDRGGKAPEPTSALFSTRRDGTASVDVPGSLEGVRAVMVTDEPSGGSPKPTGRIILTASPA